ncbi:MAG TPA: DUF6484 domain-containing protein [Acetobacteraceae bacterium]|nr:DUF6484 domain-containing protein [Acetobacteraceae bacterium]
MSSLRDKRFSRTESGDARIVAKPTDVVIGRVVALAKDGSPMVNYPGLRAGVPVKAAATASYELVPTGSAVALMFIGGDRSKPLAIGVVAEQEPEPEPAAPQVEETLTLTAAREIVLQCGRASLVLTRAGKVLVRGAYVSLRSSGMQRITGASVQIN